MTISIDTSRVPKDKQDHPEYQRLYSKLKVELTAAHSIETYCIHEAGHLIFFRRGRFQQFRFRGPAITYDAFGSHKDETKRFNAFFAAVETPETSRIRQYDGCVLTMLARGAAAGEVFNEIRQQAPPVIIDRSSDFDMFDEHCRRALRSNLNIGYDAKGRWRDAQNVVKAYLADPSHEGEIQNAIAEVRYGCFKLR